MRKVVERQTDTATWAADSTIRTELLKNGIVTEIHMTAELTPSATLTGANQPDGLFRVVQNMRIEGGSHTYFTLPADDAAMGGTLWHYINQLDGYGLGHNDGAVAAPSRTFTSVNYVFHTGVRPKTPWGRANRFDLSAFIPASKETQLNAIWVTSGNDVMDDTVTLASAAMRFHLYTILGSEGEILSELGRQGVPLPSGAKGMIPAWTSEVFAHTATSSDYAEERNLPTGGYLTRVHHAVQDATATRSNRAGDEVTGISVRNGRDGTFVTREFVEHKYLDRAGGTNMTANDAIEDFGGNVPAGLFTTDLREFATNPVSAEYGLNLMAPGLARGDFTYGMTIGTYAAGDDSLFAYERYIPINAGVPIA